MRLVAFPKTRRLGRVRLERSTSGTRPGWMLTVQMGPGAGYRWMDFGPYRNSVSRKWYEGLSVTGRTFRMGCGITDRRGATPRIRRFVATGLTKNANVALFPGWW